MRPGKQDSRKPWAYHKCQAVSTHLHHVYQGPQHPLPLPRGRDTPEHRPREQPHGSVCPWTKTPATPLGTRIEGCSSWTCFGAPEARGCLSVIWPWPTEARTHRSKHQSRGGGEPQDTRSRSHGWKVRGLQSSPSGGHRSGKAGQRPSRSPLPDPPVGQ